MQQASDLMLSPTFQPTTSAYIRIVAGVARLRAITPERGSWLMYCGHIEREAAPCARSAADTADHRRLHHS